MRSPEKPLTIGNAAGFLLRSLILPTVGLIVGAAIVGEGRFASFNPTLLQWVLLAAGAIVLMALSVVVTARWSLLLGYIRRLLTSVLAAMGWARSNWRSILGAALLSVGVLASFLSTGSIIAAAGLAALAVGLLLLAAPATRRGGQAQCVPLPVGTFTTASFRPMYPGLPQGKPTLDGIPFILTADGHMFDTSAARYIESDGTIKADLTISDRVPALRAVHILINAGGAFRVDRESDNPLEWIKIGEIQLHFSDGGSQVTSLVLGGNIREWAPGNSPGKLIDRVDDPMSRLAWRGTNPAGHAAVLDRLQINVPQSRKAMRLTRITFVRTIPRNAPSSQGGSVHYFVCAVTLERR